jgi:hypothetical protein
MFIDPTIEKKLVIAWIWLLLVARLGDQKFDSQFFWAMFKNILVITQKNLPSNWNMI